MSLPKTTLLAMASSLALATTATAGGMAEPVPTPVIAAPAPVAPVVAPGRDWTGFYAGAQLGYGQADSPAFGGEVEDTLYGVHAGYLYDFGQFVIGAELDYDWTEITGEGIDLENVARAKAIVGYDGGNFMPYLTAGLARAYAGGALEDDDDGTFYGLGLTYQFSDNMRFGAEVLQHDFEDFAGSGADIEALTATLRVSFTF